MKKKLSIFILFFLIAITYAQTPNEFIAISEEAIANENWEKAISVLQDGIKANPKNQKLFLHLGKIYYNKELYKLAYKVFKKGFNINKNDIELLNYMSNTAAALNKDHEALDYMKKYLSLIPEDRYAVATYGWLCFKCHQTQSGINFLLNNIQEFGEHISVYNSLGTLYSEIFDYKNAKKFYTKAIKLAKDENKTYSASIYLYNKSILESQFYNFQQAYEDAESTLQINERDSGYLLLGELEERKNNFSEALKNYLIASQSSTSQMAKLNIINIFLCTGNFEKAENYILQVLKNTNNAWISEYGLSLNQFKSNLYDMLKVLYQEKYNFESTKLSLNFSDWCLIKNNKIKFLLKYKYYDSVSRIYTLKVAKEFKKNDANSFADASYFIHINNYYYQAFFEKGAKAKKYLLRAGNMERKFVPKAEGKYIAEQAVNEQDLKSLQNGINKMDSIWEANMLTQFYADGIKIAQKKSHNSYYLFSELLLEMNPALFLKNDIKLPIQLKIDSNKMQDIGIKKSFINSTINSSRFVEDKNAPFNLEIKANQNNLLMQLLNKNGYPLFSKNFNWSNPSKVNFKKALNEFTKELFLIKL